MGPGLENRVGDQDTGSPDRPVSSGLQMPVEPGHLSDNNRTTLVTFPRRFLSRCPSIAPVEMSNTPR